MSLAEADMGVTQMAMDSSSNARFQGDEFLLVKFFTHPKLNKAKSAEAGRPIYEEMPYIQIMTPGNKDSIIQRPATAMDKNRFAEHFRKFQARESQDAVDGTLLEEWPGITRGQCEELKFFNVRTVEQLVGLADANSQNIMGIQALKQRATAYLEEADGNAAKQALADQRALNEQLVARLDEMQSRLDEADSELPEPKPKAKRKARAKKD